MWFLGVFFFIPAAGDALAGGVEVSAGKVPLIQNYLNKRENSLFFFPSDLNSFQNKIQKTATATKPGEETGPFNIGNPVEFTMLELAQVVKEVVNPRAEIVFRENTADDPSRRKPDISKAKAALGWEPTVPLREGLKFMVKDFAARLRVEVPEGAQVA